jgi:hypothetical protein
MLRQECCSWKALWISNSATADVVVVFEPAVNAELNVTSWFRLNAGVSYRVATGVNQEGLRNRDFSGLAAAVTFKFGGF